MTKAKARAKNITTSKKGEKKGVLGVSELGEAQLRYLNKDCRRDGLPIEAMADPEYMIQAMIEGKIEKLTYISILIERYKKDDPKIKDAVIPDFGKYLKSKYCKTIDPSNLREIKEWEESLDSVPDKQKYNTLTWNDFRKRRKEKLNEYNQGQSLEVFAPNTLRIFPLTALLDYTELGSFKIIQDDCNDMVDFLKHVKKLSPFFLIIIFLRIDEIESRFNYLSGYFNLEYQWDKKIKEHMSKVGKKGGERPKKNQPILQAVTQYLQKNSKLINASSEQIANSFKSHVSEDEPITVNIDGCEWAVYYDNEGDGYITAKTYEINKKKPEKSLKIVTIKNYYIPEAKKIINKT